MTAFTMPRLAAAIALAAVLMPAHALQPAEVYAKVAPSVWRVQTYDADGLPLGIGSAVVIATDTLVTNCHVLAKAKRVAVKREKVSIDAKLEMWDPQRDVCRITAPMLNAPAVELGEALKLQVGQNVYAIGNPRGLDLTMSAGLLSSVRRNEKDQIILLQTSAAISKGSSGGGLFDDQGVLIGLTTLASVTGDAQNLNFAVPVDWVRELPQRHARLTAKTTAAAASAPPATTVATAPPPAPAVSASAPRSACVGAGNRPPPSTPDGAPVLDVAQLPHASDKMRDGYRVFLSCPLPRAFAISEGGRWWYTWSTVPSDKTAPKDPSERALFNCERTNSGHCFLYAVDERVVYEPASDAAK
jgi:hypothetical protein